MANRIMVVDDEAPVLEMYRRAFEGAGYNVITASTAEEALQKVKQEMTNVIFLDLNLPDMTGIELGKALKQLNPIVCLLAVTGYSSLFELASCREAGFDDYFTKPVKFGRLFKAAQDSFEKLGRWTDRSSRGVQPPGGH